jgi:hypothetical protein
VSSQYGREGREGGGGEEAHKEARGAVREVPESEPECGREAVRHTVRGRDRLAHISHSFH